MTAIKIFIVAAGGIIRQADNIEDALRHALPDRYFIGSGGIAWGPDFLASANTIEKLSENFEILIPSSEGEVRRYFPDGIFVYPASEKLWAALHEPNSTIVSYSILPCGRADFREPETNEHFYVELKEFMADEAMARVLLVCLRSGYRGRGIFKCMDENRNLWSCLKTAGLFDHLPWAEACIGAQDLFFENLLAAIRPTFPNAGRDISLLYKSYPQPWPGEDYSNHLIHFVVVDSQSVKECLERTLQVCDPVDGALGGLLVHMDMNRLLFQTFRDDPETFKNVAWIGGWLEDNDIFFEDLFNALGGFLRHSERSGSYPRQWPGENYDRYLIRSRLLLQALSAHQRIDQGNKSEKPMPLCLVKTKSE